MKQQGFTLIELIIVIVILGILAVTAAPRFIDIQSDARSETLQGVKAALQGASQLVYAKSAIKGVQNSAAGEVTVNGATLDTKYGYPDADDISTANDKVAELQKFVDIELATDDSLDLKLVDTSGNDGMFRIQYTSIPTTTSNGSVSGCFIQYNNATSGGTPTYTVNTASC